MNLKQTYSINQKMKTVQTHTLSQTIKLTSLISLSNMELIEHLKEICLENPVLYLKEKRQETDSFPNSPQYKNSSYYCKSTTRFNREAADQKQQFIENGLGAPVTLQDHLLKQLGLQVIPPVCLRQSLEI